MINVEVSKLLGIECHLLDDDGHLAVIDTPFLYSDGDSIPVYLEQVASKIRFFDDGEVLARFMGFGHLLDEPGDTRFIEELVEPSGVTLNPDGEFEIWADMGKIPETFAHYVSAILAIIRWEYEEDERIKQRRREAELTDAVDA
jgi:hypothetical protein